ncbi:MAG: hypothetical protein MJY53_01085 [Bacteroidales bacterium]|nr:hypothetical protein [Bacteroidales bacterium]
MIEVEILSPEQSRHLDVEAIFLPGVQGEFEVLINHAPIISLLAAGKIKWRYSDGEKAGSEDSLEIKGGVVRLKDNRMQICIEK